MTLSVWVNGVCAPEKTVQAVFLSPGANRNKKGPAFVASHGIEGSFTMRVRIC